MYSAVRDVVHGVVVVAAGCLGVACLPSGLELASRRPNGTMLGGFMDPVSVRPYTHGKEKARPGRGS